MQRRRSRDARQEILAVAERKFAEAGFSGTSVEDVISATHYTRPTLYYHFGSKAGLFQALLDHAYDECHALMEKAAARRTGLAEKLEDILADLFEFLRDRQSLTRLAFAAAFAAPRELPPTPGHEAKRRRNFDFFHNLIRLGLKQGLLDRHFNSRELTYGIFGALSFHLMANVLMPETRLDRKAACRVVALFFQGAAAR